MRQTGFSQRNGFLEIRDAKQLDLTRESFGDANHAMSVSICFYDRQDFGGTNSFAHETGVVAQGAAIDFSPASVCVSVFGPASLYAAAEDKAFPTMVERVFRGPRPPRFPRGGLRLA